MLTAPAVAYFAIALFPIVVAAMSVYIYRKMKPKVGATWVLFGGLIFLSFGGVIAYLVYDATRIGSVRYFCRRCDSGYYMLATEPTAFWVTSCAWYLASALFLGIAVACFRWTIAGPPSGP